MGLAKSARHDEITVVSHMSALSGLHVWLRFGPLVTVSWPGMSGASVGVRAKDYKLPRLWDSKPNLSLNLHVDKTGTYISLNTQHDVELFTYVNISKTPFRCLLRFESSSVSKYIVFRICLKNRLVTGFQRSFFQIFAGVALYTAIENTAEGC